MRRYPQLTGEGTFRATAEIVEVKAVKDTTVLHWRLVSPDGASVDPSGNWASGGTGSVNTSELVVIDPTGKQRLKPYLSKRGDTTLCVCSDLPRDVDQGGVDLYATLPGLAATTTTVAVALPQFPVMKGIKVTR